MEESKMCSVETAEEIVLLEKGSTLQRCSEALVLNKKASQTLVNEGNEIVNEITLKGMDEAIWHRSKEYLKRCKLTREEMNCRRKEYTRLMDGAKSNFITLENLINPLTVGSAAAMINQYKEQFEKDLLKKIRAQEELLMKRSEKAKKSILRSKKMNEEEKEEAMKVLSDETINKQLMLQKLSISTKFVPEVLHKEGYLEIINYWWKQVGMSLSNEELQRALSTMITFTVREAKNGRYINSRNIRYKEVAYSK